MPPSEPLSRVRFRAIREFVWHFFKAIFVAIIRIIWGIFDSLLSLFG